jgi:putative ABC transport system substrate-binding protein
MKRRSFLAGLAVALTGARSLAQAQARAARVGVLNFGGAPSAGSPAEPITRHLRALGYVEGSTVVFERRYAAGVPERFPDLAADLLRSKVDVIFTPGTDVARAFRDARPTVPVIFLISDDAVASGLVQNIARPGGQFTGISLMSPELGEKRLELLKLAVPGLRRVAVLHDGSHAFYLAQMRAPAKTLGLDLIPIAFRALADFPAAFATAVSERAQAMFVTPSRFTLFYTARVAELSIQHRLPAISPYDTFASAGGLLSYGPMLDDGVARAAALIDKVLKGAKPADLPVEQPPRIALVINRKASDAIGVKLPPALMLQAERVIE